LIISNFSKGSRIDIFMTPNTKMAEKRLGIEDKLKLGTWNA
jgi:hypothetical protein